MVLRTDWTHAASVLAASTRRSRLHPSIHAPRQQVYVTVQGTRARPDSQSLPTPVAPSPSLTLTLPLRHAPGQVSGLKEAARQLSNPRPRPHSLPDIVFLPSSTRILALDEVVPAKPHVLVRSDDLDKARALQHSGNVIGNLSVNNRSHSHSLTHTVVSSGTATVGVLTPPPTNKNKSSGGISGLLDAADRVREEDDMDARKKGKLSPRELTFDDGDDAVYVKSEVGVEERPAGEEPTPESKVVSKNVG